MGHHVPGICTIDLWLWRLDLPASDIARLYRCLSSDEQVRADRFLAPTHRADYIAGRGRLREILGGELTRPADQVRFAYGPAGKPVLAGAPPPLQFNLSHTGSIAVLAVTPHHTVGVDIEHIRPLKDDISRRFFSPAETSAIAALPAHARRAAFYRCWTRKEAFVKATGAGLATPLQSFTVSVAADAPPALLHIANQPPAETARWRLIHFEPQIDIVGAVAVLLPTPDTSMAVRHRSAWPGLRISIDR